MKRGKGLTCFIWVSLFLIFGSGLLLFAGAIAGATFPRLTQFWVGGGLILFGIYLSSEFENRE